MGTRLGDRFSGMVKTSSGPLIEQLVAILAISVQTVRHEICMIFIMCKCMLERSTKRA